MDTRGIDFGFGFLTQESSFDIQFSLIDYDGSYSYARAYLVGLLNTLLVSAIGIFFATVLGVVVGISRLSSNYLIAKLAEVYVEIFRNIPLLLQIFFWYFAALRALPLPKEAVSFFDVSFLTIKGFFIPKFVWTNFSVFILFFCSSSCVHSFYLCLWKKKTGIDRRKNTYIFYFSRFINNTTFDCSSFRRGKFRFLSILSLYNNLLRFLISKAVLTLFQS